jgi:hypothetical protein
MREFNMALLGKWCWRMLVDREGLWYRVLVARYGEEDGVLKDGGRRASGWWRDIVRLRAVWEESGLGIVSINGGEWEKYLFLD